VLWVRRDARRRESGRSLGWVVGLRITGPAFPLAFAVYLHGRPAAADATPPSERTDRVLRNVAAASVLSFVGVAVAAPPDPFTQAYAIAVAMPVLVLLAVLAAYRDVLAAALG
jgi:hypothetical protein